MTITEITIQEEWKPATAEFLQSWEWGEFQRAVGQEPIRLNIDNEYVQGFVHRLPLGWKYVYIPRCTISNLASVTSFFQNKKVLFIRIEPDQSSDKALMPDARCLMTRCRQPQHTMVLDLTQSEETLLANMHSKTRYNIKLAEKKGVEIREGKDVNVFWRLNEETTDRDKFKSHDKAYYAKMLEMKSTHQLTAWYDEKPIASQIYIGNAGVCTYLHGASSNEYRNVMAPYLLQWKSMQIAKKFGNKTYDFWGVAAPKQDGNTFHTYAWDDADKLSNVTRYKAGFGGKAISYPDACEMPLKPFQYKLFQLAKKVL